jgi:hypothetical protein
MVLLGPRPAEGPAARPVSAHGRPGGQPVDRHLGAAVAGGGPVEVQAPGGVAPQQQAAAGGFGGASLEVDAGRAADRGGIELPGRHHASEGQIIALGVAVERVEAGDEVHRGQAITAGTLEPAQREAGVDLHQLTHGLQLDGAVEGQQDLALGIEQGEAAAGHPLALGPLQALEAAEEDAAVGEAAVALPALSPVGLDRDGRAAGLHGQPQSRIVQQGQRLVR